jgi:hypothetical protein
MTINKLFDENDEAEHVEDENLEHSSFTEEDEDEEFVLQPKHRDKIFENDYNTGNLDFEEYNLPKVDQFYAETNLDDTYDAYEYSRKINLEKLVDQYFKETEHGKLFGNKKKLPKQVLSQVFVSIREKFINNDFSGSEIFSTVADYFRMNYEVLYENIPSVYREELVKELDEKYSILAKRGLKKLF